MLIRDEIKKREDRIKSVNIDEITKGILESSKRLKSEIRFLGDDQYGQYKFSQEQNGQTRYIFIDPDNIQFYIDCIDMAKKLDTDLARRAKRQSVKADFQKQLKLGQYETTMMSVDEAIS